MTDVDGSILDKFTVFIKPVRNPTLTKFCTELTSITQSDVDAAPGLIEALTLFDEWLSPYENYLFCSWGKYDLNQLNADCAYHNVRSPLAHVEHVNIKTQFAKAQGIKPRGLSRALALVGMTFEGNHHRGIDDAENMVRLLPYIDGKLKFKQQNKNVK